MDSHSTGYHVVDPSDTEPFDGGHREFRAIGRALGLEKLGVNLVDVEPGGQLPLHYHSHDEQEEAFFVVSGTLHVETPTDRDDAKRATAGGERGGTTRGADGEFVVDAGMLFVVEPGNPHRAFVPDDADGPVRVLAVGAPPVDDVQRYEP